MCEPTAGGKAWSPLLLHPPGKEGLYPLSKAPSSCPGGQGHFSSAWGTSTVFLPLGLLGFLLHPSLSGLTLAPTQVPDP